MNICLIFMDDMTFRAIRALNNREVETPNLDKLVRRGMAFTHAHNQGGWSGAVCIPARAMLLTGHSLWRCRDHIDNPQTPLLGEWFGRHGYATYFVGKWHNSEAAIARSYQHKTYNNGGMYHSTPEGGDAYNRPTTGNRWRPDDPMQKGHWLDIGGKIVHTSEHWANAAINYIAAAKTQEKPFFLHVALHAPHDPRQAPPEYLDKYPAEKIALPPNYLPQHPFDNGDLQVRDEKLAPFPRTPEAVQTHRREYYAILTHADYHIGRILDALPENTLVAFSGDHGIAIGQHGLMGKQNLYDHSIRVPLLFAGPGVPKNQRSDALIYQNQLYATLCDLAGVPQPAGIENPSLAPLIRGEKQEKDAAVYGAYLKLQRMVRTRTHKLIVYPNVRRVQLFDIKNDPWETKDLSDDPKQQKRIRALWNRLNDLQRAYSDPLELPYFEPNTRSNAV